MLFVLFYYWATFISQPSVLSDAGLIINSARTSLFRTLGLVCSSGVARFFLSRARKEVFQALKVIRSVSQFLPPSCDSSRRKYVKKRAWLSSNKIWFTKAGGGRPLAPGLEGLDSGSSWSEQGHWPRETVDLLCSQDSFLLQFGGLCTYAKVWWMD